VKKFKEIREVTKHDLSDWPADGIDDLVDMEFSMAKLKPKKDYEIQHKGRKVTLILKTKKAEKAVAHLFD
jgi:hypothetical protein